MLHPHTELKFVSPEIGYGIFVTELIPKGTITWVRDELDRTIPKQDIPKISPANLENLMKYTYRNSDGDYIFCWDLTRYVNHSYHPNSMITALGFEIAIRDILPGEEMTNDYGTLNIIEAFECANGPDGGRNFIKPDDLKNFHPIWDQQIHDAFKYTSHLAQPLERFLTTSQKSKISKITKGEMDLPSILENFYPG